MLLAVLFGLAASLNTAAKLEAAKMDERSTWQQPAYWIRRRHRSRAKNAKQSSERAACSIWPLRRARDRSLTLAASYVSEIKYVKTCVALQDSST